MVIHWNLQQVTKKSILGFYETKRFRKCSQGKPKKQNESLKWLDLWRQKGLKFLLTPESLQNDVVNRVLVTQRFHHILSDYETTLSSTLWSSPSSSCIFFIISIHGNWWIFEYQILFTQFLSFFHKACYSSLSFFRSCSFSFFFLLWLNVIFVTSHIGIFLVDSWYFDILIFCYSTTMLYFHGSSIFTMRRSLLLLLLAFHSLATIRTLLVLVASRFRAEIGSTLNDTDNFLLLKTNEDMYHTLEKAPHVDATWDYSCDAQHTFPTFTINSDTSD